MPGFALHHDRRRLDDARLSEHLTQPLGGRRKSQTADEELLSHVTPLRDLPPSRTVPGTRKTVPEAWSGEGGNPQSEPAPRPDASSVARLFRGWGPIIVYAIRPPRPCAARNLCFELRKLLGARGRNSSVRCLAPSRSGPSTGFDEFPLFP